MYYVFCCCYSVLVSRRLADPSQCRVSLYQLALDIFFDDAFQSCFEEANTTYVVLCGAPGSQHYVLLSAYPPVSGESSVCKVPARGRVRTLVLWSVVRTLVRELCSRTRVPTRARDQPSCLVSPRCSPRSGNMKVLLPSSEALG